MTNDLSDLRSPAAEPVVRAVERFLYAEADLLDEWRLHEWLELFGPTGEYQIPATDKPDGDPGRDLFLVQDDRFLLEHRVNSLLTRAAHAEYPHSRTRRMITNVRVWESGGRLLDVTANFTVHRVRSGNVDTYIGQYRHVLEQDDHTEYRFLVRKAVLDLDALRPHGKVSVIL
ncbi:p-cumate dioxygenase [Streptomyces sp. MMG1533]|uniref:aromatic-ring-hydroxylating dioxygenase subunit beta n=1 Tax=Streptomyces sp. MMG1533 TaxID=1415546 RepID=UPI0006AE770F|nr:aromatic-ring-hydroxylating dioxygenase subunit beta [Streptomyces sp. MMG1533]KOU59806.1 p-cumate dioxygenase [Streptomyces sp. MMG1533]